MSPLLIHLIAAARPNFVKLAPVYAALSRETWCIPRIIQVGVRDLTASEPFLEDLKLPTHHDLQIESGMPKAFESASNAEAIGMTVLDYHKLLQQERPDWIMLIGSTPGCLAAAITAQQNRIPTAQLEAGLRSNDPTQPEELNRRLIDTLARQLFTPSLDADDNLRREGILPNQIACVGSLVVDVLEQYREPILKRNAPSAFGLNASTYGLITLDNPTNVHHPEHLKQIAHALVEMSSKVQIIFPLHPRTEAALKRHGLFDMLIASNVMVCPSLKYLDFMSLVSKALFVITDSGMLQEETTYLGIPCLSLRKSTERPITISQGTNQLVAINALLPSIHRILQGEWPSKNPIPLWEGQAAPRIVRVMKRFAQEKQESRAGSLDFSRAESQITSF